MNIFNKLKEKYKFLNTRADKHEVDALYSILYKLVHDLDNSIDLSTKQTEDTFSFQWEKLSQGEYMLTDPWFKGEVERIICEEEILVNKSWFKGKRVLDAGCGGGRWSYGLAKMGAEITAVDINTSALELTKEALSEFGDHHRFYQTSLEELDSKIKNEKFDLVWSWGVVHHCRSFNKAFVQVCDKVKEGGLIYFYLYGRESLDMDTDLNLFKNRMIYNSLNSWEEKYEFLLNKGNGDETKIHQMHDIFAPLLNRRLEFDFVKKRLEEFGFTNVVRTNNSTELHIRAIKGNPVDEVDNYFLKPFQGKDPWISHHEK